MIGAGGGLGSLYNLKGVETIHSGCNLAHWTLSPKSANLGSAVIRLQDDRLGGKAEALGQVLGGLGGLGGGGGGFALCGERGGEGEERGGGNSLGTHSLKQLNRLPGTPGGPVETPTGRETIRDSLSVVKSQLKKKGPEFPPGLFDSVAE